MHLYLIGYRGSGKSTVGRLLANQLQRPFVDTDDWIESQSGRTIREIFKTEGESGFRDLEENAVADAAERAEATIVSVGGGAILRAVNRERMQRSGECVWLRGTAEQLYSRINADASSAGRRPNLMASGGYDEVVELLAGREPIYEQLAQLTVHTDDRAPDSIMAEIAAWVRRNE